MLQYNIIFIYVLGTVLAIACSYLHEMESPPSTPEPETAVYIRHVTDQETKPK